MLYPCYAYQPNVDKNDYNPCYKNDYNTQKYTTKYSTKVLTHTSTYGIKAYYNTSTPVFDKAQG